jgi:multidrug transporter EmrE-like cation transporter
VDNLRAGWVYILVTGVVHALYIILLSHSYKIGDLTIVYPIARGSSVAFVAIFSHLIIPHYRITTLGSAGIAMVVAGICFMAVKSRELKCRKPHGDVPMRKLEETPTATASMGDCNNSDNDGDVHAAHAVDVHVRMTQQQVLVAVGFALTVGTCTAVSSSTVCCALLD